ncbi:MAG: sulfatase-like hydrolase/transferase, partial [Candidatus Subteraquimicrobiales bacterium]|nr:sulfatase-like hydrolase/transferase [Candidatus Subteraquimicrobiales bacterium]
MFKWLEENRDDNFFCFVHYYDLHLPYIPPEGWDKIFFNDEFYGAERNLPIVADGWGAENEIPRIGGIPRSAVLKKQGSDKGETDIRHYISQYDSCVRYADHFLGKLVTELKELGVFDETLIIITADHGDAMGENDVWFYHSLTVTPDQTHVPLLIKPHGAWSIKPRGIEVPVSLVDIFPTICDLMDFDYSNIDIDGSSLVSLGREEKDDIIESRTIISEIEGQIAYIDKDRIKIEPKKVDKDKLVFFYVEDLCSKHYIYSTKTLKEVNPMKFTGERYIPTLDSPEISYEHWHRYLYATRFVKDKVVLDIACGEGYGSYLLSQYAKRVVGIDISPEVIDYAGSKHVNGGLEFRVGSASNIPVDGEAIFDVVVSFETIEHINEDDQRGFLKEIKRLLKSDGLFIVSTPNKLVYTDIPDHRNEFHIKEFYIGEFKEFLGAYFENIKLLGQKIYPVSYIWDANYKEATLVEYKLSYSEDGFRPSEEPKSILYAIAICSDKEIDNGTASVLVDLSERILKQRDQHIGNLEAAIRDKDTYIANV